MRQRETELLDRFRALERSAGDEPSGAATGTSADEAPG
jgi:hypothetical protein